MDRVERRQMKRQTCKEGNEALIVFGSAPRDLSLVFITSAKSQKGSNLYVCFLQAHFLPPDISFFLRFGVGLRSAAQSDLIPKGTVHCEIRNKQYIVI